MLKMGSTGSGADHVCVYSLSVGLCNAVHPARSADIPPVDVWAAWQDVHSDKTVGRDGEDLGRTQPDALQLPRIPA